MAPRHKFKPGDRVQITLPGSRLQHISRATVIHADEYHPYYVYVVRPDNVRSVRDLQWQPLLADETLFRMNQANLEPLSDFEKLEEAINE